jgi:hypothetical protein
MGSTAAPERCVKRIPNKLTFADAAECVGSSLRYLVKEPLLLYYVE